MFIVEDLMFGTGIHEVETPQAAHEKMKELYKKEFPEAEDHELTRSYLGTYFCIKKEDSDCLCSQHGFMGNWLHMSCDLCASQLDVKLIGVTLLCEHCRHEHT